MILKSYSKINLSLSVNKKLKKKKLHDIQSFFCLINLFDRIEIKKIKGKKDVIRFKGKFAKFINKKDNSIKDVLSILRQRNLIVGFYSILIFKRIPVFAGLGGGTSNAACLIKYLIGKKINEDLLKILSNKIGSDLKLFFYKQGFLKNLTSIKKFHKSYNLYFLLVYPNIRSSTSKIYSKVKKLTLKSHYNYNNLNNKSKFLSLLKSSKNDLQFIVEKKYPIIKKLVTRIQKIKGCYFSRMTGSGSVCYGLFKSKKTAKVALNRIKLIYPKYWSVISKTI